MAIAADSVTARLHEAINQVPQNRREPLLKIVQAYREALEDQADQIDPVESFREGWKEVQEGDTRPIKGLWERADLG